MSGPVSTPYWGHLPSHSRRPSGGQHQSHDRNPSLDDPASTSRSQLRLNRESVQTQATEDSTFSPLASPTASDEDSGLAPRPPTLPYGQVKYPRDQTDKRKRRVTRNQGDFSQERSRATPPAAPDVPRAPPVSYKDPHGSGANSPYSFDASGQPGPPASAHRSAALAKALADMEAENPGSRRVSRTFEEDLEARRARRAMADTGYGGPATTGSAKRVYNGDRPDRTESHRRRDSGRRDSGRRDSVDPDGQRQMWANDWSPLQRLELTLDSLTKDEKRARVEAAERRARQKAATTAAEAGANSPTTAGPERSPAQQVHFKARRQSVGQGDYPRPVAADSRWEQSPTTTRGDIPLQRDVNDNRRSVSLGQAHHSQIPVPKNRNVSAPGAAIPPQRNLSFRERAAKNDPIVSRRDGDVDDGPISSESPLAAAPPGLPLTRSGSNKLRKNPPGDPWYSKRVEAEERFPTVRNRADEYEEPEPVNQIGVARSKTFGGTLKKQPPPPGAFEGPQGDTREPNYDEYDEEYAEPPSRARSFAAAIGLGRSMSMGAKRQPPPPRAPKQQFAREHSNGTKSVQFPDQPHTQEDDDADDHYDEEESYHHHFREYFHRDKSHPGQTVYQPPKFLEEWKKATVGQLSDALLDTQAQVPKTPENATHDSNTAWWESPSGRRRSMSSRTPKAEAFEGEYAESSKPTRFRPALHLKCGPLLRYCGLRNERSAARSRAGVSSDKQIWRGSVMIVTEDSESSYEIAPTLRMFVQPIDLLAPPPAELKGEQALLPEYVDPIAGIPKLGRRGETLYVRPVEHLEEGLDVSRQEDNNGLFESTRTAPDFSNAGAPGTFASREKRSRMDGERLGKYKDVRGFRLHAEKGCTFWRFNIEVELRDKQQRIAYRINRGPSIGFWVPSQYESMNVMFHSCNGFSLSVNPDEFSGPDPMWRDVLNTHQTRPFHVMIGGGDQIYNDAVMKKTTIFKQWLDIKNPLHKHNAPFTKDLQEELELFYLERYCMWFSQGLFGLANSQIPMVNMYDDHDIIDGFGSYPDHFMRSPVFSGLGAVAFKYYMLFQQQSIMGESEESEPSWVLGNKPGPYIHELSRSLYMSLGAGLALLAVDARTERTREEVIREETWRKVMDRCYAEIIKGETTHLLVLLGVPIAYPRLVWLENILTSRLMDPVKAMGKAGLLGNFLNRFDGGVEILDDLDDHWTSKNHKDERRFVIEDLQDLAADKSVRVTILSGDVHLAAIGQFFSNAKLQIPKHKDFRYMPNVISSAIVNTPPPDMLADVLNKRNKIHHFDKETDENMIPIFTTGVDNKPRNNKHMLPHRNWCQIRSYVPGETPPPTPPLEEYEEMPQGTPTEKRGGLLRRFSSSKQRGPSYRPDVPDEGDRSRPPLSGSGGLFRSFSRKNSTSNGEKRPGKLLRTLSLGRGDSDGPKGGMASRPSMDRRRPNDGGINGDWGAESDEDYYDATPPPVQGRRRQPTAFEGPNGQRGDKLARMGLRGGAGSAREAAEYSAGDDSYFTVTSRVPHRAYTQPTSSAAPRGGEGWTPDEQPFRPKPLGRTPTGLSTKQLKNAERWQVDVKGALDIQLNVEVNPKDPAGITVPYRLLVPKLEYEYQGEDASVSSEASPEIENGNAGIEEAPAGPKRGGTLKRLFSGRGKGGGSQYRERRGGDGAEYDYV